MDRQQNVRGWRASADLLADIPNALVLAVKGENVYYTNYTNQNQIMHFNITTSITTPYAGTTATDPEYRDGTAESATFREPYGLCIIGDYVYVSDSQNHCIRKISPATATSPRIVSTYAGSRETGNTDGPLLIARFTLPGSMVVRGNYIYVAEAHQIRVIDTVHETVSTIRINYRMPPHFTIDFFAVTDRSIYISVPGEVQILEVDIITGAISVYAGSRSGYKDDNRFLARFRWPTALVVHQNDIYVCDTMNDCIRRISLADSQVTTFRPRALGTSEPFHIIKPSMLVCDGDSLYFLNAPSDHVLSTNLVKIDLNVNVRQGAALSMYRAQPWLLGRAGAEGAAAAAAAAAGAATEPTGAATEPTVGGSRSFKKSRKARKSRKASKSIKKHN
jgi:hypothetical protein